MITQDLSRIRKHKLDSDFQELSRQILLINIIVETSILIEAHKNIYMEKENLQSLIQENSGCRRDITENRCEHFCPYYAPSTPRAPNICHFDPSARSVDLFSRFCLRVCSLLQPFYRPSAFELTPRPLQRLLFYFILLSFRPI